MKRLKIQNFGPLGEVDINLSSINLIIGPQSSGKSCILKIACYCSWVEKRIELSQSIKEFESGSSFIDTLMDYHNLIGYKHDEAIIEYESSYMKFSYSHINRHFDFSWKRHRWNYKRTKISYVPSERNLVSAINSWTKLPLPKDFLDFVSDWNFAREFFPMDKEILDQKVRYRFDSTKQQDWVSVGEDGEILLQTTSSGLQSLIPLFVHLHFLSHGQYIVKKDDSYESKKEKINLYSILFKKAFNYRAKNINHISDLVFESHQKDILGAISAENFEKMQKTYNRFIQTDHSEIFLEEPETNLFPPTQCQLVDLLIEMATTKHHDNFFIATHSPYVMNRFLEQDLKDFALFLAHKGSGKTIVKTATPEEVQEIYDNNVDSFFNIETYR